MIDDDDNFEKDFEGFGEDEKLTEAKVPDGSKPKEGEDKPTEEKLEEPEGEDKPEKPEEPEKPVEEAPETPTEPPAPEAPQALTKDDVKSVLTDILSTERNSSKELETTTEEIIQSYYPDGLSNVLVDESTGRQLRTPADVVEASGGTMSIEEASSWLMNKQYELDKSLSDIRDNARQIAELNVNFKRDAVAVVQKYEPLFKAYPQIQQKVYDKLMKQVKVDQEKGVILSAPDVMEYYDDYLEPYQMAFERSSGTPATAPTPEPPAPEAPPEPTVDDRLDESGDGGATPVNDPNDFAQQVTKELAKDY